MTTTAQNIKFGAEVLTETVTSAQTVNLATESFLLSPNYTGQATQLTSEVLASAVLAGPGRLIQLPIEVSGNVPDAPTQLLTLTSEAIGNIPDPQVQFTELCVEILYSPYAQQYPVRFREKAVLLFGRMQSILGAYQPPRVTDTIAGLELEFADLVETTISEYGETSLGRSAAVSINNVTRTISFETLFPAVNTIESLTVGKLPLSYWLAACGAAIEFSAGVIVLTNEVRSTTKLSMEVHRLAENATGQNTYRIVDSLGIVGLDLLAGKLGKFNFKFSGNPELPIYSEKLSPDFRQQKLNILGPIKRNNILEATLTDLDAEVVTNFCFQRLQTDSLFGFDLVQSQLSDGELFDLVPKPGSVALTVAVSNENSEVFLTPEYCLGKRYYLKLRLGNWQYPITLEFTELQLADYKKAPIGELAGLSIGFINSGFTRLTFTGPATP